MRTTTAAGLGANANHGGAGIGTADLKGVAMSSALAFQVLTGLSLTGIMRSELREPRDYGLRIGAISGRRNACVGALTRYAIS